MLDKYGSTHLVEAYNNVLQCVLWLRKMMVLPMEVEAATTYQLLDHHHGEHSHSHAKGHSHAHGGETCNHNHHDHEHVDGHHRHSSDDEEHDGANAQSSGGLIGWATSLFGASSNGATNPAQLDENEEIYMKRAYSAV